MIMAILRDIILKRFVEEDSSDAHQSEEVDFFMNRSQKKTAVTHTEAILFCVWTAVAPTTTARARGDYLQRFVYSQFRNKLSLHIKLG